MAGIYIHIPFCSQFCSYCDFYSVKQTEKVNEFTESLIKEIVIRSNDFKNKGLTVDTVYFGGGTPSLISITSLKAILNALFEGYPLSPNGVKEQTIEVNPDDITPQYLHGLKECGFNRLSMGIQSFNDRHLKWMNRRHNALTAFNAFEMARKAGFTNISIDLIFGFEMLTTEKWKENLQKAISLSPEHISAYQMSIERGTNLFKNYTKGAYLQPSDESSAKQYEMLGQELAKGGYIHYEVSSFCKPGLFSQHNSSYWNFTPYFGFGPSAHSFDGTFRHRNFSSLAKYIKTMKTGEGFGTSHKQSAKERFNEYIMLSLRRADGIDKWFLESDFSKFITPQFQSELNRLIESGYLLEESGKIRIPPGHLFVSDGIIRDLFA